jgi:hypothetical protein
LIPAEWPRPPALAQGRPSDQALLADRPTCKEPLRLFTAPCGSRRGLATVACAAGEKDAQRPIAFVRPIVD